MRADLGDHTTEADDTGGPGQPVVLVHSALLDRHVWDTVTPLLGFRAITYDLRGHGAAAQAAGTRGRELLLAAQGLIQVVLPTARPVIRPGDAILVTDGPIVSCRNLGDDEARVFWLTLSLPGLPDS